MPWYSVRVLLRFTVKGRPKRRVEQYEDRIMLVRSRSHESAQRKARAMVRRSERPYKNVRGEMVIWRLQTVYESVELFDARLRDGTEVYWRFIRSSSPVQRLRREGTMNASY
jgi:hypothetical protein